MSQVSMPKYCGCILPSGSLIWIGLSSTLFVLTMIGSTSVIQLIAFGVALSINAFGFYVALSRNLRFAKLYKTIVGVGFGVWLGVSLTTKNQLENRLQSIASADPDSVNVGFTAIAISIVVVHGFVQLVVIGFASKFYKYLASLEKESQSMELQQP